MKRWHFAAYLLLVLGALFLAPTQIYALDVPPKPTGSPILDQTNTLTVDQSKTLEAKILAEEQTSSNQIGVLIMKSLEGESLEEYSIKVARAWGIGGKDNNNGVLLLVALDDRKLRIEVGYGLEGALTDIRSSQIIRNEITPAFRDNDYYGGISKGVDAIIASIHNEYTASARATQAKPSGLPWEIILFGIFFAPLWLSAILARTKSWWAGGVIGGIAGAILGLIFGFLFIGIIAIVGLIILGALFDLAVSNNYKNRKSSGISPAWWAGGTHIGGSGNSGWGGFGGGSFGGGGSSGSW